MFFVVIVALAWLYVALMMALAEATSPVGSVLGAIVTFVGYGVLPVALVSYILATPARRLARKAAERAAAEAEGGDAADTKAAKKKAERKGPPVFVPLETFTVNLADREVERYAQIGITLEVDDAKIGEQLKQYMPAIRNNILMVLAHKTSAELLEREGKTRLAEEVLRESIRPLGADTKGKDGEDAEPPVRAVHFSNFIIQ